MPLKKKTDHLAENWTVHFERVSIELTVSCKTAEISSLSVKI